MMFDKKAWMKEYNKSYNRSVEYKCIGCGATAYASKNHIQRGQRFCSRRCSYENHKRQKGPENKKWNRITTKCPRCDTGFTVWPSRLGRGKVFCSYACAWPRTTIDIQCQYCKKQFSVKTFRKSTVRFCSGQCRLRGLRLRTYKTNDGHTVDSKTEVEVCDTLSEFGIEHEVQVPVMDGRGYTCDFYLTDLGIWLEIDGLMERRGLISADSEHRFNEKRQIMESFNRDYRILCVSRGDWVEQKVLGVIYE